MKPKSVGCAVKGVYASLWNKRAIEERFFARIDQTDIAMGLAIVPAYDLESEIAANTVVVTRVLNTDDVFGYSLSVQQGNNLVTNPDPGTHSEVTIAAFIGADEPTSLTVTRFAKPTPDAPERNEPVLSSERMLELVEVAKAVEAAYCRAKPGYYPDCRSRHLSERQTGRAGPRGQDPGERAAGLQADPRVQRPLTVVGSPHSGSPCPEDLIRDLGFQVVRWIWLDLYKPGVIRDRLLRAFARTARDASLRAPSSVSAPPGSGAETDYGERSQSEPLVGLRRAVPADVTQFAQNLSQGVHEQITVG